MTIKFAAKMRKQKFKLSALLTEEVGKTWVEAETETESSS
jgi:acyl-CoA reductase-like NAD-dependent aldehyde dehydrogenase